MKTFQELTWQGAAAGRWVARIAGSLIVLFALAFLIGEGFPDLAKMGARELLILLALGCLALGLVVAWLWEAWGGLITVFAWVFVSVLAKGMAGGWALLLPAIGLLHLLCWWRLRGTAPARPANAAALSRFKLHYVFWGLLGVFLLLCANEIFGNPPLMARPVRPLEEMAGTWSAVLTTVSGQPLIAEIPVVLTIEPDGSVAGTIGDAKLTGGRLLPNRSWFGRLMKWRTEFVIQGILSHAVQSCGDTKGDRFSAPVNPAAQELAGSLFLWHPGPPAPLGLRLIKR